ncbi:hypothetical protein Adt_31065 [Abeliophyllum distichum]|uniref:Uncharacterized protein n=1 Tax=Abeliophyllum distichum TaxID=126358 RepID=A0ABD1RGJ7_9LAMI
MLFPNLYQPSVFFLNEPKYQNGQMPGAVREEMSGRCEPTGQRSDQQIFQQQSRSRRPELGVAGRRWENEEVADGGKRGRVRSAFTAVRAWTEVAPRRRGVGLDGSRGS